LIGAVHFLKAVLSVVKIPTTRPFKREELNYCTRIVMVGSNVSRSGLKYGSVYAATKAALANLVKSVAMEEGLSNVLINTVSPGPVATDSKEFGEEYKSFRNDYFETQKALNSLNRVAETCDVCHLIKFLTSLENKHITGEEIFVAG
jgi:3-oxoacyl-[acyl-carrier protein] reductase